MSVCREINTFVIDICDFVFMIIINDLLSLKSERGGVRKTLSADYQGVTNIL